MPKKQAIMARLPADLVEWLKRKAEERDRNRSWLIREALKEAKARDEAAQETA